MRVVFLEVIREPKGNNREASIVICTCGAILILWLAFLVLVVSLFAMNVTDLGVVNAGYMGVIHMKDIRIGTIQCSQARDSISARLPAYSP